MRRCLLCLAVAALAGLGSGGSMAANSMEPLAQVEEGVNFVGGVAGRVPEFWGSRDNATGVAPMARWQLGGERFAQWLGTELTVNLLDHSRWRVGPSLGVRLGRREVSDEVVRKLRPVPSTAELGAFIAYTEPLSADPRHRWGFNVAVAGATGDVYGGLYGVASAHVLKPVAPWLTLSATAGLGFAGSSFQRAYFGVAAEDAALFPSVDAVRFRPRAGVTDVRLLVGAMAHLSFNWHVVTGARYQRLVDDVAKSPIVSQRGDANQWLFGAGLMYLWR